jgi:hypothetical protein
MVAELRCGISDCAQMAVSSVGDARPSDSKAWEAEKLTCILAHREMASQAPALALRDANRATEHSQTHDGRDRQP